jgi:hypothetical protein
VPYRVTVTEISSPVMRSTAAFASSVRTGVGLGQAGVEGFQHAGQLQCA